MKVRDIPLDKIFITKNVRFDTDDELGEQMESMLRVGQLQPIGVYPRLGDPRGDYELVWGHRRLRAAQMNNEATIAAHILQNISEKDIPLIKLQENTVRKQLTTDEILAAADAIRAAHPGMTDHQIDVLIGKRPGYLGFRRSTAAAYDYLAAKGLDKKKLGTLTDSEVIDLRARMENPEKPSRGNLGSFLRKDVPRAGFRIVNPPGPNVVVVCASKGEKLRVIKSLRELAKNGVKA